MSHGSGTERGKTNLPVCVISAGGWLLVTRGICTAVVRCRLCPKSHIKIVNTYKITTYQTAVRPIAASVRHQRRRVVHIHSPHYGGWLLVTRGICAAVVRCRLCPKSHIKIVNTYKITTYQTAVRPIAASVRHQRRRVVRIIYSPHYGGIKQSICRV